MVSGDATPMYSFPQWYPLNQQSTMINCHRVQQMNRKKHRRKRKKTCFCYSSETGSRSACNTIVALSFFFVLIVVVAIAVLAIYIGMEIILDGSLRVTNGDYYSTELFNRSSQIFLSKSHTYKIMIEKVFARSILAPSVKQCIVMGFKNGSLIIFYRLILDRRKIPSRINLEETAKKILHDEITSLKPFVFTNIRMDPRQIILKKHTLNANAQIDADSEDTDQEIPIHDINPATGQKRVSQSTASIIGKKQIPIASSPPVLGTTTPARTKSTKKRQPAVEKSNKNKLPLDSTASSTSIPASKKQPYADVNKVNVYSFVSEDRESVAHPGTHSQSRAQGFGEAEVIIVPTTADEGHRSPTRVTSNISRIPASLARPPGDVIGKASDETRRNVSVLPGRSNVALNKPLRAKATTGLSTATESPTSFASPNTLYQQDVVPTTEVAVVVLNTEVVTSTSVRISYGEEAPHEEEQPRAIGTNDDQLPSITHNLQRPVHDSGHNKYKNIFPRSIRDENEDEVASEQSNKTGPPSLLSSIIETYRKQASNETLHLIIKQLAAVYAKITSRPVVTAAKTNSSQSGYSGSLMTRPMHKIPTTVILPKSTTESVAVSPTVHESNSTRKCVDGQPIMEPLWCNQFADCNDGSDEKNCTCADYLKTQFSFEKICDGVVDCWDFSDENRCEWCAPDMYVCTNAKLCVRENQVCDGIRDCPLGDDENNCITITQFQTNNTSDFVYQSTGVVTVKRAGVWGKLCHKNEPRHTSEQTLDNLKELGKAVCRTMTFKNFVNISVIRETEDKRQPVYYKLTDVVNNSTNLFRRKNFKFTKVRCDNHEIVQVSCDTLECGIQTQCGKRRAYGKYSGDRRARIIGGDSATLGAWPWQAALYKEGEFQCGATLVTSKWLLSAGHCFRNSVRDYWVARLGILRRSSTLPSPQEQIRAIRRIVVHPHYTEANFVNDISLLEMDSEVFITNFVRPVCLPNANHLLSDGTLCTVIGWGQMTESGTMYPDTLQEVQLPVMSPSECRKRTVSLPLYKITDGMLCAGFDRGGRDACLGDSGGPLMCRDSNGPWRLHGVTSNGNGCARAHRPGIYTRVTNYLNWIESNTKNTGAANAIKTATSKCNGFRCPLGECLPKALKCNGYMECSDGSDETSC